MRRITVDQRLTSWKQKAQQRRLENKLLKKDLKVLRASRQAWKHKAQAALQELQSEKKRKQLLICLIVATAKEDMECFGGS